LPESAPVHDRAVTEDLVAVCVCTYNRPRQLARLLDSLLKLARPAATMFVIVDNDSGTPETRDPVRKFREQCGAPVEYVVEARPGISAARNAGFAAARRAGARMLAMLDDDEWATSDWLMKLLETRNATGAGVVGGPVYPVFTAQKQKSGKYEKLWSVQKGSLNGRLYVYCTCNCLVDLSAAAFLGDHPFPEQFGLTGGEDAVFFRRLHFAGVVMAWSDEAVLFEEIREDRATFGWLRRRWYRHGNAGVRCERAAPDPRGLSPLLRTALLCARLPVYPLVNRKAFDAPLIWMLEAEKVRGRIACHLGMVLEEYGRPGKPRRAGQASR
jgi:succinoglycan biosynthesis protein ExoM